MAAQIAHLKRSRALWRLGIFCLAAAFMGCTDQRYHLIYGPANFELSPTPWGSPGLSIEIEQDGVIWLGPSQPAASQLGWDIRENPITEPNDG